MLAGDVELAAWLRLIHWPGLGREPLRRLLAAFGSPQAVADAPQSARLAVVGSRSAMSPEPHERDAELTAATEHWLAGSAQRCLLTVGEPGYPALLLETPDPPVWLFAEGRVELLNTPALAIVGSRQATPQGRQNARALSRQLAERGWTIVSGLASGIDAAAHEGALDATGGTIAVVGTGLDLVYPRSHQALARRVAAHGLMVSEFPLGTPPMAQNFPMRNRIIATLTRGTLVVEAAPQSGSLITARLAAEAGREVFAVPGSIHSPQSRGCHELLKQGAKLVQTADDVLEELPAARADAVAPAVSSSATTETPADHRAPAPAERDPVLRALGHDPATLDELMSRCGWPAHELHARLLELELTGDVARLPGGRFQRIGVA
jgi:DNA processing protein